MSTSRNNKNEDQRNETCSSVKTLVLSIMRCTFKGINTHNYLNRMLAACVHSSSAALDAGRERTRFVEINFARARDLAVNGHFVGKEVG